MDDATVIKALKEFDTRILLEFVENRKLVKKETTEEYPNRLGFNEKELRKELGMTTQEFDVIINPWYQECKLTFDRSTEITWFEFI